MFLLVLALLATGAPGARADSTTIAAAVDSLAARIISDGLAPGLGVAVTMDGRTILARGYGHADVSAGIRADHRTLWYLASTTKSFTGFGVALLVNAGALRLDAPITSVLPQARWHPDARPDTLTLGHFLSHTHHLNDEAVAMSAAFTGAIPESRWPQLSARAAPRKDQDLVYSNFGYNVAGMAIDRVRPEGWKEYLERDVFEPAAMRETYARVSGLDRRRIAMPCLLRSDGRYTTERFAKTDATMNSAGGHLATLRDLARWTIVQMDSGMIDGRRVFPAAAVALSQRLIAPQTVPASRRFGWFDREGWGAGWDLGKYEEEPMVSRFGSYHEFRSHLSFLPRRRIGVVAIANGGLSAVTDLVATLAYDLEAGRPDARARAERRFAELEARLRTSLERIAREDSTRASRQRQPLERALADFTGRFAEPDFGEIHFTRSGNRLEYRWGMLRGPVEIFDAARHQMRIEVGGSGTIVTFDLPEEGPARAIQIRNVTYLRVP